MTDERILELADDPSAVTPDEVRELLRAYAKDRIESICTGEPMEDKCTFCGIPRKKETVYKCVTCKDTGCVCKHCGWTTFTCTCNTDGSFDAVPCPRCKLDEKMTLEKKPLLKMPKPEVVRLGTGTRCLTCDGTGQTCNTCGEPEHACMCGYGEFDPTDCFSCFGKGT
jgi:hypothetical protein